MAHNAYRHKSYSHSKKREAYNLRKKNPNYPVGGYNRVPSHPYAGVKRRYERGVPQSVIH